jgi:hypothetical protein
MNSFDDVIAALSREFDYNFASLASPTLSKQETVTRLYQSMRSGTGQYGVLPPFPWRELILFIPRLVRMFLILVYASIRFRVRSIPRNSVIFRTWLVQRSFLGSDLVDDYFRHLPTDLALHENVVVSFTATDFDLLNKFGRARRQKNQILSHGLLSLCDVLRLLFDYVSSALILTKKQYFVDGKNVSSFINNSLLFDYFGLRSFEAYAEKYKCEALIKHNIRAFVYIFENQSWEKVCCASLSGQRIKLIGYQSSGFSPIFMNFFPTELDTKRSPLPDILLTVGDHFSDFLLENGHFSFPVETFAALRFPYRINGDRYVVHPPNTKIFGRIIYAFSVHLDQYEGIANDLFEVFRDSGIEVILKIHPLYRYQDIRCLGRVPKNFRVVFDIDMDSLRDSFDCVLFNDNSFGIEALIHGVKSYQYSKDGKFSDERLIYFNLWRKNFVLADLIKLREAILSGSYDKSFEMDSVADYINKMYRPYTFDACVRFRKLVRE